MAERKMKVQIEMVLDNTIIAILFDDLDGGKSEDVKKAIDTVDYFMKEHAVDNYVPIPDLKKYLRETKGLNVRFKVDGVEEE